MTEQQQPAEAPKPAGEPSQHMKRAIEDARSGKGGGVLEVESEGSTYQGVTDPSPERGVFEIVGGYVDGEGELHTSVELRSITGDEEDMLANDSMSPNQRMNAIMSSCVKRLGTITDRGQIAKAINSLPNGSRTHLLVCLKRTSHWRRTKDIYEMGLECPRCSNDATYAVNLGELETYDMPDPKKRVYDVELPDAGVTYSWKILSSREDEVLTVIAGDTDEDRKILTYSILVRLSAIDGEPVSLGVSDFLDSSHKKLRLSKKAEALFRQVASLGADDREDLRESFLDNEPGIDLDLDVDCKHCKKPFKAGLDVSQRSFFFPSATSRRSKRRRSS
jgi:hypothetical protein